MNTLNAKVFPLFASEPNLNLNHLCFVRMMKDADSGLNATVVLLCARNGPGEHAFKDTCAKTPQFDFELRRAAAPSVPGAVSQPELPGRGTRTNQVAWARL